MINIIGIRAQISLSPEIIAIIANADMIFAPKDKYELIKKYCKNAVFQEFIRPFAQNLPIIRENIAKNLVVLATGDPSYFGAGKIMVKEFGKENIMIYPQISIISLIAAAQKWAIEDCAILSIHGRKTAKFYPYIQPKNRIICLSDGENRPHEICELLNSSGFGESEIIVYENYQESGEKISKSTAQKGFGAKKFDNFHTMAMEIRGQGQFLSATSGINNDEFIHDNQITKQETRAIIMAKLQPFRHGVLWDIGAGNGTISVEWCRFGGSAHAVEAQELRLNNIIQNSLKFGDYAVQTYLGYAPNILPAVIPDAIFCGGGVSDYALLEALWAKLPKNGVFVASAASLEAQQTLSKFLQQYGGNLIKCDFAEHKAFSANFHRFESRHSVYIYDNRK